MDTSTGKIHEFENNEELKEAMKKEGTLVPLSESDFAKYSGLPQAERPKVWALNRYLNKLGKDPKGMELLRIKQAFKAGWDEGWGELRDDGAVLHAPEICAVRKRHNGAAGFVGDVYDPARLGGGGDAADWRR